MSHTYSLKASNDFIEDIFNSINSLQYIFYDKIFKIKLFLLSRGASILCSQHNAVSHIALFF